MRVGKTGPVIVYLCIVYGEETLKVLWSLLKQLLTAVETHHMFSFLVNCEHPRHPIVQTAFSYSSIDFKYYVAAHSGYS